MNKSIEKRLEEIAKPLLRKGRKGDWEHVTRTLDYGRYLLQHEEGEADIIIPALYLHDIGWSQIKFQDFTNAPPALANHTRSKYLHMERGAELANKILQDIGYNPVKRCVIVSIISVHDIPEKIFAMENPSATLVMEADRLDRYGLESLRRFEDIFGPDYLKGEDGQHWIAYLREGLKSWFKTRTGITSSKALAKNSGLFNCV
ncbi:HD domain-containing protein [Desulfonema magnum]|uniref:Metal dependent phosphohydrolase n=1 Tax=Desulfonema magnum TaxID=45655 RepID=A0A975BWK6_9BACT|nr:HD domain-containing protein [Desulfonema magnum]QTA93064.1 Metal dependent phosphohydrolase [Desulfonema magnum]